MTIGNELLDAFMREHIEMVYPQLRYVPLYLNDKGTITKNHYDAEYEPFDGHKPYLWCNQCSSEISEDYKDGMTNIKNTIIEHFFDYHNAEEE